ncbi:4-(cytidine 5'-diphospho)-2-C-methyl-D-erythritol kinase [Anaeromyxobacter diazotrophicus]|uniref:4-diphosphocytidyl-2-C-methyl-D-erythritol kinase n=1 Tax=Anaeromyxobacter diazotrophicus TaxID=2590199 RepID=A0A7I9VQH5_9BACT|nr:4-(cytidine 5'-diphospho)-2-C-methyl-D-erythritol kinase [Anaeromyxobacter diazotrophicus]GEJ58655.1 4-diphosphocytidyl-2-C-methyl-D-erythritol kinase [Anaeromyxobacter diazotrophicus]
MATELYRVRAPAKVNLVLRVGPPREDGYHDLATLMVPLDLADRIEVRLSRGRRGPVTCRVPGRPELDGPSNLAARAAEAFRGRFGVADAVALTVEKRVPVTAGLGGGSSDAAAVLRALARAYGVRDRQALAEAGLAVGSDVPFFLGSGPAWAAGRGERLAPAIVPPLDLVLLYPEDPRLAIRAGEAYRWLDAARQGAAVRKPLARRGSFRPAHAENDLQEPCFERHPALRALAGRLVGQGAKAAIMSGSGPTVFGIFEDRAAARRAALAAGEGAGQHVEVHVVRTLVRHPGVLRWKSPRSGSSPSARRSSRRT